MFYLERQGENERSQEGHEMLCNAPGEYDGTICCGVLVPAEMLVRMSGGVIVVWHERECPSRQYIFAKTELVEDNSQGSTITHLIES